MILPDINIENFLHIIKLNGPEKAKNPTLSIHDSIIELKKINVNYPSIACFQFSFPESFLDRENLLRQ